MTAHVPAATAVADALREGLANARRFGRSAVSAEHLEVEEFESVVTATLAHLRSVPGKPCEIEGWSKVTTRDAAVMTWWTEVATLTEGERRRLASLRAEVYDVLSGRNLIQKGEGRSTSVLVSPAAIAAEPEETYEGTEAHVVEADPSGAWILKLSPHLYDVNRVFAAPDGRVHVWAVEDHARSSSMQTGDRVYLWLDEGDPYRVAGVWGVGHVAGPAVLGAADDGWLDYQAASLASVFAVVNIVLLDVPVSRHEFLEDARLAGAEVIGDPYALNPGVLTASEAAALAECLTWVEPATEPRVA